MVSPQSSKQPCGMLDEVAFNALRRVGSSLAKAAVCMVAAWVTFRQVEACVYPRCLGAPEDVGLVDLYDFVPVVSNRQVVVRAAG